MSRAYSQVEPLTRDHRTDEFECRSEAQTIWLRRHALQAQAAETSRCYVVRRLADDRVVAYYAIATGAVLRDEVSERFAKGVGRYGQIPVILLTRLGVDVEEERRGLGTALVKDALVRVAGAADIVGARGLFIHAETDEARAFYRRLAAFDPSPVDPLHLMLLMKDLREALS